MRLPHWKGDELDRLKLAGPASKCGLGLFNQMVREAGVCRNLIIRLIFRREASCFQKRNGWY